MKVTEFYKELLEAGKVVQENLKPDSLQNSVKENVSVSKSVQRLITRLSLKIESSLTEAAMESYSHISFYPTKDIAKAEEALLNDDRVSDFTRLSDDEKETLRVILFELYFYNPDGRNTVADDTDHPLPYPLVMDENGSGEESEVWIIHNLNLLDRAA